MKPDPVLDELRKIAKQHKGLLRPSHVVTAAADPASPLHQRFTWDDKRAAHEHRLWEARELLAQYWIVEPASNEPIRLLLSLDSDRQAKAGYRFSDTVLANPDQRQEWLLMALSDFKSLQRSYGALSELTPIFAAIRRVAAKYEIATDAA